MEDYEESDYEKERRKNIEMHNEEFRKIFPEGVFLKSSSAKTNRKKRKNRLSEGYIKNIASLTPRRSISRSCKRLPGETLISRDKKIRISDDWQDTPRRPLSSGGIRFTKWEKIQQRQAEKMKDRKPITQDYFSDYVDTYSDEEFTEKLARRRYVPVLEPGPIEDVAERTSDKHYDSEYGTSCHQCRQKTIDTKTVCRNSECVGVRGQFCGPCLKNRYGECAKEALRNEAWFCPPCRGICNCSFCMKKRGKRATGILIHLAKENGYTDVKTFLGD
ncbi:cell division cycle-associated 7-like protein [Hydractinia symbiolongicarpus]|uniref:cell division cycle-associated 7-like protein n=1 Tax=Hydractinia symbiolongicarpus TaxID=13093 RepID=UPI00254AA531|nr:cell division cycle-associated 7-like protein [Hydractinia symbiolongicarpus]